MDPTKLAALLLLSSLIVTIGAQGDDAHNHAHHDHHEGHQAEITAAPPKAEAIGNATQEKVLVDGIKSIIDLSHPLNNHTLHWPLNYGFEHHVSLDGEFPNDKNVSHYLMSDGFKTAVHCGTHLDAPRHFSKTSWTVDEIPLARLVDVPVSVIDLSQKVNVSRNYMFEKADFIDKSGKSLVVANSVVLVYTGISKSYDQGAKAYFGTDTQNLTEMKIPGFSKEAAEYLVEQKVLGVGLDAPSADSSARHGLNNTYDPVAHSIFNSHNIYILENIHKNLQLLVDSHVQLHLIITPLAITGGSGSPVRLVALTSHDDCSSALKNSASSYNGFSQLVLILSVSATFFYQVMKFSHLNQL